MADIIGTSSSRVSDQSAEEVNARIRYGARRGSASRASVVGG